MHRKFSKKHYNSNKFKAFSAGSNPSGTINIDVRSFLEKNKNYDLTNYSSKNFEFIM